MRRFNTRFLIAVVGSLIVLAIASLFPSQPVRSAPLLIPSRSTTIALTSDDQRLVVVNRDANSVSVIQVRLQFFTVDTAIKIAEIPVGLEPRCVALSPDDREAYVTNAVSGTVSVIDLLKLRVVAEIPVGTEPRGCAVTPNGTLLLVTLHTEGKLVKISPATRTVLEVVSLGGNPSAIAITNNGNASDTDETIFVTDFFAKPIPGGPGEGFDTGREGVVWAIRPSPPNSITRFTLSPLRNAGFTADRTNFCPQSIPAPLVLHSTIFCPDLNAAPSSPVITQAPQGAFPNQLNSALIRGNTLILPSIGAAPEPPVRFNVNIQGLVHLVDTETLTEIAKLNLNNFVKTETQPPPGAVSLDRLFSNDIVAIDANPDGTDFLIVSRGGNYVFRFTGPSFQLRRLQTGNIPNGVVVSRDGTRAYTNNEVNFSVTALDLVNHTVLALDIPSSTPPAPGTFEHAALVGKLVFFTALGVPDNGIFRMPVRSIVPLQFRNKASDNGWSSCGSCHPDGLSDNVTWIFAAGPRQTIALDGSFNKQTPGDQRIMVWSAARGSVGTDFNNNSRGVQGGCGFASDALVPGGKCLALGTPPAPANPNIYDHGIVTGGSDALDAMNLWAETVRAPMFAVPSDRAALDRGRTIFGARCASCHGGPKWTKSTIFYRDNPAFTRDPAAGGVPVDPGVTNAGAQIRSYTVNGVTLNYLENIGTFGGIGNPLEIRANGTTALGSLGFNVPSLLGVGFYAPHLHNGAAQAMDDVFAVHGLAGGTIQSELTAQQRQDLALFVNSIDSRTATFRSEADDFRDTVALP
jgi:YVTN family beta-propeller protein